MAVHHSPRLVVYSIYRDVNPVHHAINLCNGIVHNFKNISTGFQEKSIVSLNFICLENVVALFQKKRLDIFYLNINV